MRTIPELERLAKEAGLKRCFAVFQGEKAARVIRGYDSTGRLRQVVLDDESVMTDTQIKEVVSTMVEGAH